MCRRWHHIVCERRNFLPKVQYTRLALDIIDDTINGCLVRFGDRDLSCADVVIEPPVSAERMMLARYASMFSLEVLMFQQTFLHHEWH